MQTLKRVKYKEWDCWLQQDLYHYGERIALHLVDAQDGEPVSTCTVNVPELELAPDEICIKNYSENKGMLNFLIKEGVVEDTGRTERSGYVEINICRLKEPFYGRIKT